MSEDKIVFLTKQETLKKVDEKKGLFRLCDNIRKRYGREYLGTDCDTGEHYITKE